MAGVSTAAARVWHGRMQEMAERSVGGKVDLDDAPSRVTGLTHCKERLSLRSATDGVASSQARAQK